MAFAQVNERLRQAGDDAAVVAALESATCFLLGLRYDKGMVRRLYGNAAMLEESTTYQDTLRRGEIRLLLVMGRKRFGPASPELEAALYDVEDRARIERMAERIFEVAGWDELLATA